MDYTTLIASSSTAGSIANWMNHASLQSAAPIIIGEAESLVYRRLRAWQMLKSTTGTFTIGSGTITLPADFIQPEDLMITGINKRSLSLKTPQEVRGAYMYDGSGARIQQQASIYYFDQTNFVFDTLSDQAYPYDLLYYQQPAALGPSNTTNFLTSRYPRMFRCAITAGSAEFMKDAGAGQIDRTYWLQQLDAEINAANIEQDQSRHRVQAGAIIVGGSDSSDGGY